MLYTDLQPGDGSRYRVAWTRLPSETTRMMGFAFHNKPTCILFLFAEGDDPGVWYTFNDHEATGYWYFQSKIRFRNQHTTRMAYCFLMAIAGIELDGSELDEHFFLTYCCRPEFQREIARVKQLARGL